MRPATLRYSRLIRTVHWLTAALVLLAYLTSDGGARVRTEPQTLHVVLGLSVLTLTFCRLLARFAGGVPPPLESAHKRMIRMARIGHGVIYLLLLAVPIIGWFTVSRLGLRIELLGHQLPLLTAAVQDDPGLIANIHQVGGNLLLIVAGCHAAMALWHHFRLRDRSLHRISPF
jgi:cytochrome b561